MNTLFNKIIKNIPSDLSAQLTIKDYSSSKISIIRVENAFATPNAYDTYKFLLPLNSYKYPDEIIGKNKYQLKNEEIIPINPGQPHCSEIYNEPIIKIPPVLVIFIDKEFIEDTAKKTFEESEVVFINKSCKINNKLRKLINLFIEEYIHQQTGYQLILENLNMQITINILRILKNNCTNNIDNKSYFDKKSVNYLIDYLHENFNQKLALDELARTINYSPFHLIRLFKTETGKTPFEYLLDIKINKAKELLKSTGLSIKDICFSCGFNNRSHFSVIFKRKTNYSPSQYRKIIKR
ncbi:MAG: helix-turn-helix domain-containing protein [Halanaerobiales bacterium]